MEAMLASRWEMGEENNLECLDTGNYCTLHAGQTCVEVSRPGVQRCGIYVH